MHFDDGMDEIITLPDDTVRLTGEVVAVKLTPGILASVSSHSIGFIS